MSNISLFSIATASATVCSNLQVRANWWAALQNMARIQNKCETDKFWKKCL